MKYKSPSRSYCAITSVVTGNGSSSVATTAGGKLPSRCPSTLLGLLRYCGSYSASSASEMLRPPRVSIVAS